MAISAFQPVLRYLGDGLQSAWPITFPFLEATHVCASIRLSLQNTAQASAVSETFEKKTALILQYGQDYTVNQTGTLHGGTLHCLVPENALLTIWLDVPITQEMVLTRSGYLSPPDLELAFDKQTLIAAQLAHASTRSVKVPVESEESPESLLNRLFEARDAAEDKALAASQSALSALQNATYCHSALKEMENSKENALDAVFRRESQALEVLSAAEEASTTRMVTKVETAGTAQIALATAQAAFAAEQVERATAQADIAANAATRIVDVLDIEGISDDVTLDSASFVATSRAVKKAYDAAFMATFPGMVCPYAGAFMEDGVTPRHADTGEALTGWRLCNGEGGTPDLQNMFIRGASPQEKGETGGTESHTHTLAGNTGNISAAGTVASTTPGNVGTTTLTADQMPAHRHGIYKERSIGGSVVNGNVQWRFVVGDTNRRNDTNTMSEFYGELAHGDVCAYTGSSWGHAHTSAAHAHTFTGTAHNHALPETGVSTQNHTPPYYSLCYILRLSQEVL